MQWLQIKLSRATQKIGRDNTAYIFWVLASILWNLGFIFPAEHKISVTAANLSRGLGLIIVNSLGLYWRELFTDRPSPHVAMTGQQTFYASLRHVLLAIYSYGFTEAQFYLPSPVLYTIYFSGPLFVMILEYLLYGVTLTARELKGVVYTSFGVLLTANGPLILSWITGDSTFNTNFKNYKTDSVIVKSLVAVGIIVLTFGWACAVIVVRKIKGKSHWTLNFNLGYILVFSSAMLYFMGSDPAIQSHPQLFLECIVKQGLVIALAQLFFMSALLLTSKSGTVCMIGFVSVIFSYFLSIYRYDQPVNILCVVGSLVALVGIYYTVIK